MSRGPVRTERDGPPREFCSVRKSLSVPGVGATFLTICGPAAAYARDVPALSVSHCGHGSVMRALAAGVPLVCLPIGRDQNENAARVAAHGAGVRLRKSASVAAIRGAVAGVPRDPSYRRAAGALSEAIAAEGAGDPAVGELEGLVRVGRAVGVARGDRRP